MSPPPSGSQAQPQTMSSSSMAARLTTMPTRPRTGTGIVIWSGKSFDILKGIDTLRFTDKDVKADANGQFNIHAAPGGNGEKLYTNVSGIQHLQGTTDKDVFVVGANKAGYGYSKTQDGNGIVVWKGSDFDVLHGFEILRFNDQDITLSGNV